jgi:hypothetical protein
MKKLLLLATMALLPLALAAARAPDAGGGTAAARNCANDAEVIVWTGTDWIRIATALARDHAPCQESWVSIPPLAADKKGLRVLQDDAVRALGVHPVAEMVLGDTTGWANWVASGQGTWFQAGVEHRRRMAAAGYSGPNETWLLNELDRSTMRDSPREAPDHPVPAYRRADMLQLLQGLYYGDPGMPTLPGIVEIGIHFRHQNIPNVAQYKEELKSWLGDDAFWTAVSPATHRLAVEVYADVRLWGVQGSTRNQRGQRLRQYQQHVLELVRNGPSSIGAAKALFERAYVPLANAGYRARGGEQFAFITGHGNTIVDAVTMQHFVSEQVDAIRRYASSVRGRAPSDRIAFSWQPCNRTRADDPGCGVFDAAFQVELDAITARLASAIRHAYGTSPASACSPPEGGNWCNGSVPGAAFTTAWEGFGSWD